MADVDSDEEIFITQNVFSQESNTVQDLYLLNEILAGGEVAPIEKDHAVCLDRDTEKQPRIIVRVSDAEPEKNEKRIPEATNYNTYWAVS